MHWFDVDLTLQSNLSLTTGWGYLLLQPPSGMQRQSCSPDGIRDLEDPARSMVERIRPGMILAQPAWLMIQHSIFGRDIAFYRSTRKPSQNSNGKN